MSLRSEHLNYLWAQRTRGERETERWKEGRKQDGVENIVGREEVRKTVQRDKLRDKFEILLGLLRATARIQDSVNYAPKCFIIKHFASVNCRAYDGVE